MINTPTWRGRPIPLTRSAIEDEIERLVELLDVVDSDPELEPVLGWPQQGIEALDPALVPDDREEENEHGGSIENEPSFLMHL